MESRCVNISMGLTTMLIGKITAGMKNGNGWVKWTINNSDIGPGDTYRVCENTKQPGQAVHNL